MPQSNSSSVLSTLGFSCLILIGSLDSVLKYGGVWGLIGYLMLGSLGLLLGIRYALPRFLTLSDKTAYVISAVLLVMVIAVTVFVYPTADQTSPGGGSDADDALKIAGRELLSGNYPYYPPTYLGNHISPMPGAVFFALPFVIAGLLPLQNIFWLVVLFFFVRHVFASSAAALGLVGVVLATNPTVWQNLVTGSDYVSNSIYILVLMWLLVRITSDERAMAWTKVGVAVLLGIGLSSRANFLFLLPLLFSVLAQSIGFRSGLKYMAIAGLAFLLTTIPFWLYDPAHFGPFIAQSGKMRTIESVLPFAGIIIPAIGFGLAGLLSLQRMSTDCRDFFRNCAIVQVAVLLFTSTVHSFHLGKLDLYVGQAGYGMFTLFFAVVAAWMTFLDLGENRSVSPSI
jgi:hypothetical protein